MPDYPSMKSLNELIPKSSNITFGLIPREVQIFLKTCFDINGFSNAVNL